jgi:hypothetical protein
MEAFFVKTFWITVIMLWAALLILYLILTNRASLKRKGHSEKYIAYLRRSHTIRILLISVLLPLLILLSAWIIGRVTGPLNEEVQMAYIVIVLVLLVIPFKFIDERVNQRRIRELALVTKEKVAVDFNYRVLHRIYNPVWELVLGPAAFLYGFFYLRIEQWIIYLFLLFPWFMYLNLRGTRYQTRPYLKDNYNYTFSFNIFNFLFFLLYFCAYFLIEARQVFTQSPDAGSILLLFIGLILILAWVSRICIYLANYRGFNKVISGEEEPGTSSGSRKMGFIASGIVLIFSVMGIALLSGLLKNQHIEVGRVHQKLIMQEHQDHRDTLLVIDQYYSLPESEYENYFRMQDIKLSCRIKLSRTEQLKCYDVCCPSIFRELQTGQIIKFEYGSGPSIMKIIEP